MIMTIAAFKDGVKTLIEMAVTTVIVSKEYSMQ